VQEQHEPIRLRLEVPNFPWFSLSQFEQVISSLEVTSTSHLESYNPRSRHWEQHSVDTASEVEKDQRVLYRVRKSLLEGFRDEECVGLKDEVELQTKCRRSSPGSSFPSLHESSSSSRKRPAKEVPTGPPHPQAKKVISYGEPGPPQQIGPFGYPAGQAYPHEPPNQALPQFSFTEPYHAIYASPTGGAAAPAPGLGASAYPRPRQDTSVSERGYNYTFQAFSHSQPPVSLYSPMAPPQTAGAPIPNPDSRPKKWPTDFSVAEIARGFREMDALRLSGRPSITQKKAFEDVFGCRHVKSTVSRHRNIWKRAPLVLKEEMGNSERTLWGEFVRIVEGKQPGKAAETVLPEPPPQPDGPLPVEELEDPLSRTPTVVSTQPGLSICSISLVSFSYRIFQSRLRCLVQYKKPCPCRARYLCKVCPRLDR
jgi:hypothetical protein